MDHSGFYNAVWKDLLWALGKIEASTGPLYLESFSWPLETASHVTKVNFLGFIIEHGKMTMDPVKLAGIADWPAPSTLRQLRSFLGFGNSGCPGCPALPPRPPCPSYGYLGWKLGSRARWPIFPHLKYAPVLNASSRCLMERASIYRNHIYFENEVK